jgi:hypothetical protein
VVVNFDATASAASPRSDEDDDVAVRRLDQLLRFHTEVLEGLLQLTQDIADRVAPTEDAVGVDDRGSLVQLEVGSEQVGIEVASVGALNPFDVLLRHRPPSIPLAREGRH